MTVYQCPCLSRLLDDSCRMRFENPGELREHCRRIHGLFLDDVRLWWEFSAGDLGQQTLAIDPQFTPAQLYRLRYWQWARLTGRAPS